VGRSSNHKKPRPQHARGPDAAGPSFRAEGRKQLRLLVRQHAVREAYETRGVQYLLASWAWTDGAEPLPARVPQWMQGSMGQRFAANPFLMEARNAPPVLTADIPAAAVIIANPMHWHVAANVLIRAVVFDNLEENHPAVSAVAKALGPVVEAELRNAPVARAWLDNAFESRHPGNQAMPGWPVIDGPLLLLGTYVLATAARALADSDSPDGELAVLSHALDDVIPGVAGSVVADALTHDYPLETMVAEGTAKPADILGAGLAILSALVRLCRTNSGSVSRRVA
jgi:hypothetical protein